MNLDENFEEEEKNDENKNEKDKNPKNQEQKSETKQQEQQEMTIESGVPDLESQEIELDQNKE